MPKKTHGMSESPDRKAWTSMIQRCVNPRNSAYKNYGGRGIFVCDRWLRGFAEFMADMGPRPAGMSLERIDNDGPYSPENCRWASRHDQSRNHRRNVWVTHEGETMVMADLAKRLGLAPNTLRTRLRRGWPLSRAVTPSMMPWRARDHVCSRPADITSTRAQPRRVG